MFVLCGIRFLIKPSSFFGPSHIILIICRDGNIPVSFIQKYLMRKLDLKSEAEVSNLFL